MSSREIHQCECQECQTQNQVIRQQHEQMNLLMSRLDEQQRRWSAALEANKRGHGGTKEVRGCKKISSWFWGIVFLASKACSLKT